MAGSFPNPRLAAHGVTLVFSLLSLFTVTVVISALGGQAPGEQMLTSIAPLPFYLFALWAARATIVQIGRGEALRALVSPVLRRIGWALFLGGIVHVFIVPWLWALQKRGSVASFDINAMTLGAVGMTLIIIARLVADAERDRAELDDIV